MYEFVRITGAGAILAYSAGTPDSITIPDDWGGNQAQYVAVSNKGVGGLAVVNFTSAITEDDFSITADARPSYLSCRGHSTIWSESQSGSNNLVVVPIEPAGVYPMIRVTGLGTTLVCTAGGGTVAIPTEESGATARYVAIHHINGSTVEAHIRPVQSGGAATTSDMTLPVDASKVYLEVTGFTHIAGIRSATPNQTIQIVPVEPAV